MQLDPTDREIVTLLERDARRTLVDIGGRVGLSSPAVKRRIARLEADGVIEGYTIRVDHARLGRPLQAFVELRFAGNIGVDDIAGTAAGEAEVEAVFTIAGDPDAIALVRAADVVHLKRVIDHLRRSGRVTGTKTLMVIDTWTRPGT